MKKLVITLISIFFFAASCSKEEAIGIKKDGNGVIVSLPHEWKVSLHEGTPRSSSIIKVPIQYKNGIVIPTTGDNKRYVSMIDVDNGNLLWKWSDIADTYSLDYEGRINIYHAFQKENLLTYQRGSWSFCINLEDGTTYWKKKRERTYDIRLYPNTSSTFLLKGEFNNESGYLEANASICDIDDGNITELVRANYSSEYIAPNNLVGAITNILRVPSSNLYATTYVEPLPNWNVNSFLGLYNSQTKEWVYERKLMAQPTQNSSVYRPQIYNNKLYASVGKNLVCHDLATGEQLWTRSFTQDFFLSGFIIEEDKIIAYNENQTLYCLDPSSGQTIWENKEVRSSTPMNYLNGVVYLVGGNFYAVEVSTGKTLWNITAGSTGESSSNYFRPNAIYVLPAKDGNVAKVVALSNLYAYCFKAHQ